MTSVRVKAALLPILFLFAPAAMAEGAGPTTLTSLNGSAILQGVLKAADAESFTLETVVGVYLIRRADVTCVGFCPDGNLSLDADATKVAQSG